MLQQIHDGFQIVQCGASGLVSIARFPFQQSQDEFINATWDRVSTPPQTGHRRRHLSKHQLVQIGRRDRVLSAHSAIEQNAYAV
jgi:hypothetical protein